jgi:predicted SnoaL-like aldol condensation-catalyzing enzyme
MRHLALLLLASTVVLSAPVTAKDLETRNKAVARSFFEDVLDKGKLEDYAKSHAPDFVAHSEGSLASLEEDMAAAREQRKALPDMRVKVNHIVAEGELVSVYWTASGTNTAAGCPRRSCRSRAPVAVRWPGSRRRAPARRPCCCSRRSTGGATAGSCGRSGRGTRTDSRGWRGTSGWMSWTTRRRPPLLPRRSRHRGHPGPPFPRCGHPRPGHPWHQGRGPLPLPLSGRPRDRRRPGRYR